MRLAVRPHVTTGVAIVGASVLIANPATLPSLQLPSIQRVAAAAATLPNPGDVLNGAIAGFLDLLPDASNSTAQPSVAPPTPADALITAIIIAGSTGVNVTDNTPVNLLAAAQQVAAHPDQLPEVLAALPAEVLKAVGAIAKNLTGVLTPLGTYLGSLASGAVGVTLTAANTIINALPSTSMAAPTAQASTLAAPDPVEAFNLANIAGGSALTRLLVNTPVDVLAAAQQVAADPGQLPEALAALSAKLQKGVSDLAKALTGVVLAFGPYLGQLATSAVDVVVTAANTIINGLGDLFPSTMMAAATAQASTAALPSLPTLALGPIHAATKIVAHPTEAPTILEDSTEALERLGSGVLPPTVKAVNTVAHNLTEAGLPKVVETSLVQTEKVGVTVIQAQGLVRSGAVGAVQGIVDATTTGGNVATALSGGATKIQKAVLGDSTATGTVRKLGAVGSLNKSVSDAAKAVRDSLNPN